MLNALTPRPLLVLQNGHPLGALQHNRRPTPTHPLPDRPDVLHQSDHLPSQLLVVQRGKRFNLIKAAHIRLQLIYGTTTLGRPDDRTFGESESTAAECIVKHPPYQWSLSIVMNV